MKSAMTIAGASRVGDTSFAVLDPATDELVGEAPQCGETDLDTAMNAAQAAFPAWAKDKAARREMLHAAAEKVRSAAADLGTLFVREQGRPLRQAAGEISVSASWLDYYADLELEAEPLVDGPGYRAVMDRRPLGVVAAITPWNAPVLLAMWKIAPALAAGNTMVLKPSPVAPLTLLAIGDLLRDVLPLGVLNVISGEEPLGSMMIDHPVPRKISFTGSVTVGKAVAVRAAQDLKRVTLELGGNDPAILLDDVDVDAVADDLFYSAFMNCGQICEAVKRVYVPEDLHGPLVDALADRARAAKVGNGLDPTTQIGPLTVAAQRDRVDGLVRDAVAHGGRIVAGGRKIEGTGNFYQPTIVAGVTDGIRLVDEEQFGPALPVIAYRNLDDVVARCNGSMYGLTASVWSPDEERAGNVGRRLQVGKAKVNGHGRLPVPHVPFGGIKWSGIGVENGLPGLHEYTTIQVSEIYGSRIT
jgi:acyl-CoA reductase-like NAD-dependent aldehyde dehydrogenase